MKRHLIFACYSIAVIAGHSSPLTEHVTLDELERAYKRNYINKIKQEMMQTTVAAHLHQQNPSMQKVEEIYTPVYSNLTRVILALQDTMNVLNTASNQKNTEMAVVYISLKPSGMATVAHLDSITGNTDLDIDTFRKSIHKLSIPLIPGLVDVIRLQLPVNAPVKRQPSRQ